MSVSSTEHLDKLAFILYDRPAGRNVIGYAIEKIEQLRADNERLLQAVGLATTTVPDMQVDIEDPVGMMQRVVAEVDRLRAQIERLRAENERLRADLATQQGCCDGAAAQDAHVRQERKERRAEINNLRASNKRMRELLSAIQIDTNADGSVWLTLSPSAYPGFIAVVYLGSQKLMAGTAALLFDELRRKALEGKP